MMELEAESGVNFSVVEMQLRSVGLFRWNEGRVARMLFGQIL